MPSYRVDARSVLAMGAGLVDLGEALATAGDPSADRWALGPGEVGPAVEELLGGWRHTRVVLAGSLVDLGSATVGVGGAYLDADAGVSRSLGGGPTSGTGGPVGAGPTWRPDAAMERDAPWGSGGAAGGEVTWGSGRAS